MFISEPLHKKTKSDIYLTNASSKYRSWISTNWSLGTENTEPAHNQEENEASISDNGGLLSNEHRLQRNGRKISKACIGCSDNVTPRNTTLRVEQQSVPAHPP
jgi:hypothetical protein